MVKQTNSKIAERAKAEWDDIRADPDATIRRTKWAVWANTTGIQLIKALCQPPSIRNAVIEECAAYHDKEAQHCFEQQAACAELAPCSAHNYWNRGNEHLEHAKAIRALTQVKPDAG